MIAMVIMVVIAMVMPVVVVFTVSVVMSIVFFFTHNVGSQLMNFDFFIILEDT